MMAQIKDELKAEVEHEACAYLAFYFRPPFRLEILVQVQDIFFPFHLYKNHILLFGVFLCIEFNLTYLFCV